MLRGVWYRDQFLSVANLRMSPVTAGTVSSGDSAEYFLLSFVPSSPIETPSVDWFDLVMPVLLEYFVYFPLLPLHDTKLSY